MKGWVKIHRTLLDWAKRNSVDDKTFRLFVTLILEAEFEDSDDLLRGQVHTTLKELSEETQMTMKALRVRLERLAKSGEITIENAKSGRNGGTIITINNYALYQDKEYDVTQKTAQKTAQKITQKNESEVVDFEIVEYDNSAGHNTNNGTNNGTKNGTIVIPPYENPPHTPHKVNPPIIPQENLRKNATTTRAYAHTREWWANYKMRLLDAYFESSRQESLMTICRQLRSGNSAPLTLQELRRLAEDCIDEWRVNEMPPDTERVAFANLTNHIRKKFYEESRQKRQRANENFNRFGYNSEEARQQRQNAMLEYIRTNKPSVFTDGNSGS